MIVGENTILDHVDVRVSHSNEALWNLKGI